MSGVYVILGRLACCDLFFWFELFEPTLICCAVWDRLVHDLVSQATDYSSSLRARWRSVSVPVFFVCQPLLYSAFSPCTTER
jgi:hypothetical protein